MSASLYWRRRSEGKGTVVESETAATAAAAVAARRLIKGGRWSVKCVCVRRLICGCDLEQLFLCSVLKMDPRSFPSRPAALFMLPV